MDFARQAKGGKLSKTGDFQRKWRMIQKNPAKSLKMKAETLNPKSSAGHFLQCQCKRVTHSPSARLQQGRQMLQTS